MAGNPWVAWIAALCVVGWFIEVLCDFSARLRAWLTKDSRIVADVNVVMQAGHPDVEAPARRASAERPDDRYMAQHELINHRRRTR